MATETTHTVTNVNSTATIKDVLTVADQLRAEMSQTITSEIHAETLRTKATEDVRANKRNRNRVYTLMVALAFTFIVPFVLATLGMVGALKYATGISIVPDAVITLWAYAKKY